MQPLGDVYCCMGILMIGHDETNGCQTPTGWQKSDWNTNRLAEVAYKSAYRILVFSICRYTAPHPYLLPHCIAFKKRFCL